MTKEKKSWWTTLSGILTGTAAVITAITGLVIALGIGNSKGNTPRQFTRWVCENNNCISKNVTNESIGYSSISTCKSNCKENKPKKYTRWICEQKVCISKQVSNSTSGFSSKTDCQNNCKNSNSSYPTKRHNSITWMAKDLEVKPNASTSSFKKYGGRYFYHPNIRKSLCPDGWRLPLAGEYFQLSNGDIKANLLKLNFTKPGRLSDGRLVNHHQFTYLVDGGIISFTKDGIADSVTSGGNMLYPCRCIKK